MLAMFDSKSVNTILRYKTVWAFAVFLCLAVYTLGANPFAGETVAPMDLLLSWPGWSSAHTGSFEPKRDINTQPCDILNAQLPLWITLKQQIRSGQNPLWYPYGGGGQPVAAEIWNPCFWIFTVVDDNALAYYVVGLSKLVIAGVGCYLLCTLFLRWLPSVWGGIVYMLCGFNAAWFYWEQVTTSMWIPWLLWAATAYLRSNERQWLPVISLISLLMIFGGFPSVAAFGFYAFALLIIIWYLADRMSGDSSAVPPGDRLKSFMAKMIFPFAAAGIAFVMAGVWLIPFMDSMSGINLDYRIGNTYFQGIHDLKLFLLATQPFTIETTAFIGVPAFCLACIGCVVAVRRPDAMLKRFVLFYALLLVITVLLAFGLLPHSVIRKIPVFGSNDWNRLIVLSDLALSVLSAAGLHYILESIIPVIGPHPRPGATTRWTVIMLCIAAAFMQFISQKNLFNAYNDIVPSTWFYPETSGIRFMKQRLEPLQSVIADNSFGMGGTLGAYGIPEWYAHSFRTDQEKIVLGDLVREPFASATISDVHATNIRLDSPLMDKLAIKYVVLSKYIMEKKQLLSMRDFSPAVAPPLPANQWRQYFSLQEDTMVSSIGFRFVTYGGQHAPADVLLSLFNAHGAKFFMDLIVNKDKISDNDWADFKFSRSLLLKKGTYYLELSFAAGSGVGRLSAWTVRGYEKSGNYLEVGGRNTGSSLNMRFVVHPTWNPDRFKTSWNLMDVERNIVVMENPRVASGAYFVRTLDPTEPTIDFSHTRVRRISAGLIHVAHTDEGPGWVVLPMHFHPGWKAFVNDRPVNYDAYLDILPAIPVKGESRIVFTYQPASFRAGAAVSAVGILIFVLFLRFCLKKRGRA